MKKFPIFVTALLPLLASADTESIPSIVVLNSKGTNAYHVHLADYNRIEVNDDHYNLKANSGDSNDDLKLNYNQYPRFWVENVSESLPTSIDQPANSNAQLISYCKPLQVLQTDAPGNFKISVYNPDGQLVLTGKLSDNKTLSVTGLPSGIYIAYAEGTAENSTLKFVKH